LLREFIEALLEGLDVQDGDRERTDAAMGTAGSAGDLT
jgi:hypothetical protein